MRLRRTTKSLHDTCAIARDLLSNDYESGDASWVTGRFKNLNAQIGSYETYDDELFGVKTFFSFCLLQSRQQETTAAPGDERTPGARRFASVSEPQEGARGHSGGRLRCGCDFGQSRGGNTATILPNESYLARRYGRTILLRANIMRDTSIFEGTSRTLAAAIGEQQAKELTPDGNFYRTLWHEVGHYLGVDQPDGRELDEALQDNANAMEEMKADLVSLFVAEALHKQGITRMRSYAVFTPVAFCECCRTIVTPRPALQHDAVDAVELFRERVAEFRSGDEDDASQLRQVS